MNKTEHPYANVLRWIADGEIVQQQVATRGERGWCDMDPDGMLSCIADSAIEPTQYRLKPRTININGHEVPEPLRVAPDKPGGVEYYVPWFSANGSTARFIWNDILSDHWMLSRGLCHTTRVAAEAHARALLSFTTQEAA